MTYKDRETVKAIKHRPLHEIASEIRKDWLKPYFGAKPYIDALSQGNHVSDTYLIGDYRSIITGFLANAQSWRGDTARRVKAELHAIIG